MNFAECDFEESDSNELMEYLQSWKSTTDQCYRQQQQQQMDCSVAQDPWLYNPGYLAAPEFAVGGLGQPPQLPECDCPPLTEINPADCDQVFCDLLPPNCGQFEALPPASVPAVEDANLSELTRFQQPSMSVASLRQRIASETNDPETLELLDELLMDDDDDDGGDAGCCHQLHQQHQHQRQQQYQHQQTGTTSEPQLPLFEPQPQQHQVRHQLDCVVEEQRPLSPAGSQGGSSGSGGYLVDNRYSAASDLSSDREAEIDRMAAYIKEVIEKSTDTKPDDMSSKLKVHEVILTILLNSAHGDKSKDLRRILAFCDENGRESTVECQHFKTLDTETMGVLWQKIKRNRKASYDTFARAMRVRREKSRGYFDYLDAGKRSKKRIYRFGEKTMAEMARLKQTLRLFSEPQACGY